MTNKSQATALAAKGILIGFTVLGTVFGWAQLSATSLASDQVVRCRLT